MEYSERDIGNGLAALCPECNRVVRALNPRGGDGTMRKFATHGPVKDRCPGSRQICPGWE